MEVPEEVLQVLKCSRCEGLLSCGPVYLCLKGEGLCNTCFSGETDTTAIRNIHYEAVADLLLFPCKNQDEGCKVKIPFNNPTKHEEECPHRKYACPLQSSSVCEWSGTFNHIVDHCQDQHPDKVLDSPIILTHDITKFSSHTYLLRAFQLLFILFTKVCVTSGKIYYSIRYVGSSNEAQNFRYNLTITREDETVTRKGKVDPQECLAFQEDSSLIININNLMDMLGGFDDTTFTLTMQQIYLGGKEKCSECGILLKVKEYNNSNGWKCVHCAPSKKCCSFKGCSFQTFPEKLEKHVFFCDFISHRTCIVCKKLLDTNVVQHHEKEHRKYSNDSACRVVEKTEVYFLISSDAGLTMCKYSWTKSNFNLYVYSPLSNDQLSNFRCKVRVIELASGHIRTYTPNVSYNKEYDWLVTVTKEDFNDWSDSFDIFVCISKMK